MDSGFDLGFLGDLPMMAVAQALVDDHLIFDHHPQG